MAVPFYIPDAEESGEIDLQHQQQQQHNHHHHQSSPSGTTSTQPTPLQSPVNAEHLVSAFCEALYRYSYQDSPRWQHPPPSPSCSSASPYSASDLNTEFVFPHYCHYTVMASTNEDQRLQSPRTPARITRRHRIRLSSTGEEADDDEPSMNMEEHYHLMAARERLQEFPGRVPKKKKSSKQSATTTLTSDQPINQSITARDTKSCKNTNAIINKEQTLAWPAVVTAVVIAVGCGYLVTR